MILGSIRKSIEREVGATVMEMVVVTAILLVVMAIVLPALVSAQRTQQFSQERNEAMNDLRFTANFVAKDIRSAREVLEGSSDDTLRLDVGTTEAPQLIQYSLAEDDGVWNLERSDAIGTRIFVVNIPTSSNTFEYRNGAGADAGPRAAVAVVLNLTTRPNPRYGSVELETEATLRNV